MLPILTIQRKFPKQKQKTNRLELSNVRNSVRN